jgi:hypothetical protein
MNATLASSEATVAGLLANEWPATPSGFIAKIIAEAPRCFSDERLGRIVAAGRELAAEGIPVELVSLSRRSGEAVTVGTLARGCASADLAELEAKTVWQAFLAREAEGVLQDQLSALRADPAQAIEAMPGALNYLVETVGSLKGAGPSLRERVKARMFRVSERPPAPVARFTLAKVPIHTPGNIGVISGPAKTAKSTVQAAMIASVVSPDPLGRDFLGFTGNNPEGLPVIHFDTEQSLYDHWKLLDSALRRAGVSQEPSWLRSYCLTGFPFKEARESVNQLVEEAVNEFGGVHSVFIDGVADLVADVNDPEECNSFVAELHGKAIEWDAPIITVIHLNPGSEKTRGHLGSQLERKAETNLRLERDGEAIVAWSEKNRGAPIPKESAPRFKWSDTARMHVSTDSLGIVRDSEKRASLRETAVAVFQQAEKSALTWTEIHEGIEKVEGLKRGGSRKRFALMKAFGILGEGALNTYTLNP